MKTTVSFGFILSTRLCVLAANCSKWTTICYTEICTTFWFEFRLFHP